jgi:hypothetical protein
MATSASRTRTEKDRAQDDPFFGYLLADNPRLLEAVNLTGKQPGGWTSYRAATKEIFADTCNLLIECSHPGVVGSIVYRPVNANIQCTTLDELYISDGRMNENLSELRRKIASFAQLGPNWDGENAEPISAESVDTAEHVVERIAIVLERRTAYAHPSVRAFPDGSIFFKWIQGQKELAITVLGQAIEAQRWQPLQAFCSQGLWQISLDEISEQVEWVLT